MNDPAGGIDRPNRFEFLERRAGPDPAVKGNSVAFTGQLPAGFGPQRRRRVGSETNRNGPDQRQK